MSNMNRINFMKSQNFEFIRAGNEALANLGGLAEAVIFIDPGSALTRLRNFAEEVTKSIYEEENLPRHPQASFSELLRDRIFEGCVNASLLHQLNYLRIQGNETAHGAEGNLRNACSVLGIAYQLAMYMAIKYYDIRKNDIPPFKDIKDPTEELKTLKKSVVDYKNDLDQQKKQLEEALEDLDKERTKNSDKIPEPAPQDVVKRQQESKQVADSLQWDEAKTREMMIDKMIVNAGWELKNKDVVGQEIELDCPENPSGKGYADYILWGDNGQPLAVIEAKRASNENLQAGREQARLYADACERMGYDRPVIFYTNGYETFIWDDTQYNTYRRVYGIYSKDSLEYLIYQRTYRDKDLEKNNPDLSIAGRPYQIEAIKKVAHHFQEQSRKALIIQATGTGKTRVAIAISELLLRSSWAKRVLFLCDRKELRVQADEAFKEHLSSEPRCVIGETNIIDTTARIYIATYPGMMNRFAQIDVGFFDLIIADESHRSIYNKYGDIFEYFDALQLGLTATPVKFISRNTFSMFGCKDTDPTFEFGLDKAIYNDPPYLVPYKAKDLTTEFLREGIHYNDLTDEQKKQLEEDLGYEEAINTTIAGKDIGRKIFSEDTDRIILENLINNGIKDSTGSLVGKTIIFAQRQDHAEHLEQLFCDLYPQYGAKVCKVIHNAIPKVDSLIKEFKKGDNDFRIAISVDMLDTGIDVPEIVNLVFAKPVKSHVKFWQMIGRGTRLRPNLFGPGKDKTEFRIFDHYSNFQYFDEEYKEPEDAGSKSLLQTTFEARVELVQAALKQNHAPAFDVAIEMIRADINDLTDDSIAVKRELRTVHKLQQTEQLKEIDAATLNILENTIAPLMSSRVLKDKHATQLDRLIAQIQRCMIEQASCFEDGRDQLIEDLNQLAVNIQAVRNKDAIIQKVQTASFWQDATIESLEDARKQLRGIMKYRKSHNSSLYGTSATSTKDSDVVEIEREIYLAGENEALEYRKRLKAVLDEMINANPVLQKIRNGEAIAKTEMEQLTSTILTSYPGLNLVVLNEFYGRTADNLYLTLREIIGLNPKAVEQQFTEFLHNHPGLTSDQVTFMNMLREYLAQHGTITIDKLYEAPFDRLSHEGIDGVFEHKDVDDLIGILRPFLRDDKDADQQTAQ